MYTLRFYNKWFSIVEYAIDEGIKSQPLCGASFKRVIISQYVTYNSFTQFPQIYIKLSNSLNFEDNDSRKLPLK